MMQSSDEWHRLSENGIALKDEWVIVQGAYELNHCRQAMEALQFWRDCAIISTIVGWRCHLAWLMALLDFNTLNMNMMKLVSRLTVMPLWARNEWQRCLREGSNIQIVCLVRSEFCCITRIDCTTTPLFERTWMSSSNAMIRIRTLSWYGTCARLPNTMIMVLPSW